MKVRKGCWTCRGRKIHCDGGRPGCQKCARSKRECQGYELRLSWPRDNDKKRAITGTSPPAATRPLRGTHLPFINTTSQDVEVYHQLYLRIPLLPRPRSPPELWKQLQGTVGFTELLQYFHDTAHLSLVTFTTKASRIRDTLIRMALVSDSASASAVLHAVLAYSSLHRTGLHQQAVQLKVSTLQLLSASVRQGPPSGTEAAQQAAASMLLGAFEILLPSESSGEWLWYVRGAMDTLRAAHLTDQSHESDIDYLLDWIFYHDALSRFPMHHWRHKSLALGIARTASSEPRGFQYPTLVKYRPASPSPIPEHAVLNLLSEICDTVVEPGDPRRHDIEYQRRLRTFESELGALPLLPASTKPDIETGIAVQLYHTTTRIYLIRASQSSCQPYTRIESLIEETYARHVLASNCISCGHFFPLFIIACEARTEEHRSAILSLINRSERDSRIRSMRGLRKGIQSIWVQQDLHADEDLLVNYLGVLSAAISSSETIPSFV
ncbi:hypothetical protein GQ53DRAFT_687393 [Thozetella sp. PMI_491]|nr:hypothetical protein GQ53DRAFT_687393 [Thozetella sp. PMI_491]